MRWPLNKKSPIGSSNKRLPLLLVLLLISLSGCDSTERMAVIEGMSMAPHLYGVHSKLACEDCGFETVLRGDRPIENPICPNCGAASQSEKLKTYPAPAVKVRALTKPPERWNVYAFFVRQPNGDKRVTVKRLAALPNEELAISEGDLWVDGKRVSKNWNQQRQLAVLMRDFQFLPREKSGNALLPWQIIGEEKSWTINREGICYRPGNAPDRTTKIEYTNWAGYHSGLPRFNPLPVMNALPFDPLEAGSLTPVHDLLLEAEITSAAGDFRLEWHLFSEPLTVDFLASQQKLSVRAGESLIHSFPWTPPPRGSLIGCSTFDRCLTVALNNKQLVQIPILLTPSADREQLSRPLALVGLDAELSLKGLKLYRDVHYYDRLGDAGPESEQRRYKLGRDEYFFLGDNPADSIDSRDWSSPGLSLKQVIGSVSE
ncbi:MAG: hypothetical protein ACKO0N_03395 [Planctomycetota bacterium]